MRTEPPVVIETWCLTFDGRCWSAGAPTVSAREHGAGHPHDQAAEDARQRGIVPRIVHSTSWRTVGSSVCLTYVVIADHGPRDTATFRVHGDGRHEVLGTPAEHLVHAERDACRPPGGIGDRDVVHHALHHVALLAATDPSVAQALTDAERCSLVCLAPDGAGELPRRAVA